MAKTVKHANLEFPKARARLKPGRQPHWQALSTHGTHLGYQRQKGKGSGRWLLRRYLGGGNTYRVTPLGVADDAQAANGTSVLSYAQAKGKAGAMIDTPEGDKVQRMTVRQAMERYVEHKRNLGQSVADVMSRGTAHILPTLGDMVIAELTAERLQRWLANMASMSAQNRPKKGKVQFRPAPEDDEGVRKRRNTANRVLTMLKAILNHAFDEKHVSNRDAWGRRLKPFRQVDTARVRYLTVAEAQRLINACPADFRALVRGALETGARYSELARLQVVDFNADSGTLAIRKSKSAKARHIILTEDGQAFFAAQCAGRAGNTLIFGHGAKGTAWKTAEQARPMREANAHAKVSPPISFHGLRHTWASLSVMNGVPLLIVAKNLGRANTIMVERHYGHLASSYVVDAIRAGAPKYAFETATNVAPLVLKKES
jgi:integrase